MKGWLWGEGLNPQGLEAGAPPSGARAHRAVVRLTGVWLLTLLSMPLAQGALGDVALHAGIVVTVLLQASISLLILVGAAGWNRALRTAAVVVVVAWASEAIGWSTGFPFGRYHYTSLLQPQLLGVPLLIPLAWLMMLPPSWALAQRITGRASGAAYVLVSALAFTAWDLFLDPQMVHWGVWAWEAEGAYFGIPVANFVGWLAVAALINLVSRPPALPTRAPIVIYALTWITETVGLLVFWRLTGPAIVGFLGMGAALLVALALSRARRDVASAFA